MRLSTLLFASYRDLAGQSVVQVDVPPGATVADLVEALRTTVAGLDRLPPEPAVAVNRTYVRSDFTLSPEDEVALIPPVAGG